MFCLKCVKKSLSLLAVLVLPAVRLDRRQCHMEAWLVTLNRGKAGAPDTA